MELKLSKESICINEVVFDGVLEQSVELDYLLPDYCESIFKILKCRIIPKITSERVSGGKLLIDGVAYIKVLYVSEDNYRIRSITQKQAFSKSAELKENYEEGCVNAFIKCDYANCRVVNPRRLDIRGALSIRATVSAVKKLEVLCGVEGMGVQINTQNVTALDKKLCAVKEFSVREELELSYGKPPAAEILDQTAAAVLTDCKLIANKAVIKGEILLHLLYCQKDPSAGPEIMDFTIPLSQIVDLPGVNEDYQCVVCFDVNSMELTLKQNGDGECTCLDGEFGVRVRVEANRNTSTQLIDDLYSTQYEVQCTRDKVKIEQLAGVVSENCVCKSAISLPQSDLSCVYDLSCGFLCESCRYEGGSILISGKLDISVLGLDSDGMPVLCEKQNSCEMKIDPHCDAGDALFSPQTAIASLSYTLLSGSEVEVRAEIRVCGSLYRCDFYDVVTAVSIDESAKKDCRDSAALRLYFAERGERVWDIAKRYNTSVEAISLENSLDTDTLPAKCMLLLPALR